MFKFVAFCALLVVAAARQSYEDIGSYSVDFVPTDTSGQGQEFKPEGSDWQNLPLPYDSAHVIQKRAFGVLENAGLGAAAAALNTFAGSFISANQASAAAANPLNKGQTGQNYPSQPSNYPNQQNNGQNYPSQPSNYPNQQNNGQNYPSQPSNYPNQQNNGQNSYPSQPTNYHQGQL